MNTKQWKRKNRAKVRNYNKNYWRDWYAKNKAKRAEQNKLFRRSNPDYFRQYARKFKQSPEQQIKIKARGKISSRIQSGALKRQICSIADCGKIAQAHHNNYSKGLEIVWLCREHHEQLHHNQ